MSGYSAAVTAFLYAGVWAVLRNSAFSEQRAGGKAAVSVRG